MDERAEPRQTAGDRVATNRWPSLVVVLGALGAWSIVVPYLGPVLGLELDVAQNVEVVDHVVPGVLIVACSAALLSLLRRDQPGSVVALGLACAIALGGLWIAATHLPLLRDASRGIVPWGTACFHTASGLIILALALPLVRHTARMPEPPSA